MLLTVIAVATLLVAVVGATFAYFSVTVSGSNTATNVTGQTGKIATLTYVTGTTDAYLEVTAADMAQPDKDTKYYATTDQLKTDSKTGGKWIGDGDAVPTTYNNEKVINLGGITLSEGGDESYTCTYTITLTKENDDTMIAALSNHTGELILDVSNVTSDNSYDLSKLGSDDSGQKVWTETFQLTSKEASTLTSSKTFDATLHLVNKQADPQNYLADKKLKLKFAYTGSCTVDNKNAPDQD